MTRHELARWLRDQAQALHEPLLDGTDLTREEAQTIHVVMDKLRMAAESIEIGTAAGLKDGMDD